MASHAGALQTDGDKDVDEPVDLCFWLLLAIVWFAVRIYLISEYMWTRISFLLGNFEPNHILNEGINRHAKYI